MPGRDLLWLASLSFLCACPDDARRAVVDASAPDIEEADEAGTDDSLTDPGDEAEDASADAEPAIEYPEEPPLYRSGSRLKALRLVPESGEPLFMGWFDTEIGEPCEFVVTSAGDRCIPGTRHWTDFNTYFSDDQCTSPDAFRPYEECVEESKYAWNADVVYHFMEAAPGSPTHPVYRKIPAGNPDAGACARADFSRTTTKRALPLTAFVAGTTRILPGGRFRRRVRESEDGALASVGVFDEERGVDCSIEWDDHGEAVCGGASVPVRLQRVGTGRLQLLVQRGAEGYLLGPSAVAGYEKMFAPYAVTHHDQELETPCAPVRSKSSWICAPTPPSGRCELGKVRSFAVPASEADYKTSASICWVYAPCVTQTSLQSSVSRPWPDVASFALIHE
jgi:hypothetical protein